MDSNNQNEDDPFFIPTDDHPLDNAQDEAKARYIWDNIIQKGQRVSVNTDTKDGQGKSAISFNRCFDLADPYWRNVCRRHVIGGSAEVELHKVAGDLVLRRKVDILVLGVYFGGVADMGTDVCQSYALDSDRTGEEGRKFLDLAMPAFPEAMFFSKENGKWHAYGRLSSVQSAVAVKNWIQSRLPIELKSIEVFPKTAKETERFHVGNQIRIPFSPELLYNPVGALRPIGAENLSHCQLETDRERQTHIPLKGVYVSLSSRLRNDVPNRDQNSPVQVSESQRINWAKAFAKSFGTVSEGYRHQKTFAVAACCLKDQGLSDLVAYDIAMEFNVSQCSPPLPPEEIKTQVECAGTYGSGSIWQPSPRSPSSAIGRALGEGRPLKGNGRLDWDIPPPEPIVIENAYDHLGDKLPLAVPDLWENIIKVGGKLFVGGPSKARKSFSLIGLALAVSHGLPYWGQKTRQSNVLYLNLEISKSSFYWRLNTVQEKMGLASKAADLHVSNLRGKSKAIELLVPEIIAAAKDKSYGMIVIDPVYKCLGRRSENDAGDMTSFCNELERIAQETGATVVCALHFTKGNASGKEAMDRISGSGVLARDPDAMLTLTPHEADDCFTVSAVLRDHPPLAEWAVRWNYPLMTIDADLDPKKLKKPGGNPVDVLDVLKASPNRDCDDGEWKTRAAIESAVKEATDAGVGRIKDLFSSAVEKKFLEEKSKKRSGTNPQKLYRRSLLGENQLGSVDPEPETAEIAEQDHSEISQL